MEEKLTERHPFTPFLPEGAKIVICGTFPPTKDKWAMDFFYPNYYNDMWRVFGLLFFNDREHFFNPAEKTVDKQGIMQMLQDHKIGIGETATEAYRMKGNASDKFLEIVKPVDLPALMEKVPQCKGVVTTGEKAASIISDLTDTPLPAMGKHENCRITMRDGTIREFSHWRMPSTSRAYPMKLEKKAEYYRNMLKEFEIL